MQNKKNLTKTQKDNIYNRLLEIERGINLIKKYKKINHGDKKYYGLKDIEHLYKDLGEYYRPILAKQAFNNNYEFYTIRGDKNKELSLKEYIDMITPYLYEIINKKKSTNQKTQLGIGINFSNLIDKEKNHTSYIKSKNIEILPGDNTNEIIKELTSSFFDNYQQKLLELRNAICYILDNVEVLGIHFHQIDLKRGSSYIKSPKWIKNKGATINPQNPKDNYCFKYAITIALNHQEINHHPERISNLIPFKYL